MHLYSGSIINDKKRVFSALDKLINLAIQHNAIQSGKFTGQGMERLKNLLEVKAWPLYSRSMSDTGSTDLPLTRLIHLALVLLNDSEALLYRGMQYQYRYVRRLQRLRGSTRGLIRSHVRQQITKINTLGWRGVLNSSIVAWNENDRLPLLYYISHPWTIPNEALFQKNVSASKLAECFRRKGGTQLKKPLKRMREWLEQQGVGVINEISFKNGINRIGIKRHCDYYSLSPLVQQRILDAVSYCYHAATEQDQAA